MSTPDTMHSIPDLLCYMQLLFRLAGLQFLNGEKLGNVYSNRKAKLKVPYFLRYKMCLFPFLYSPSPPFHLPSTPLSPQVYEVRVRKRYYITCILFLPYTHTHCIFISKGALIFKGVCITMIYDLLVV